MYTRIIASSVPPPRTWNEEILGSDKTRIAVLTCLIAAAIITSLGYFDYTPATYSKVTGASLGVVGLILPHVIRRIVPIRETTIDDLPPELLTLIFQWLSPKDRLRASAVCRQWNLLVGGHFTLERIESAEGTITFEIHRPPLSEDYYGNRKLVSERAIYMLQLHALKLARERSITREENFLLCKTIAQINSIQAAFAEARLRKLSRVDKIWLSCAIAQQVVDQDDALLPSTVMGQAENVANVGSKFFSWYWDERKLYAEQELWNFEQELWRMVAYARFAIGDQKGAIRAIKMALGYGSLGRITQEIFLAVDNQAIDFIVTLLNPYSSLYIYPRLRLDLELLQANQQIPIFPGTPIEAQVGPQNAPDPNDQTFDLLLKEGKFYEAMQQALASDNSKLLTAIVLTPYRDLHPEDPYYQDLFSAETES